MEATIFRELQIFAPATSSLKTQWSLVVTSEALVRNNNIDTKSRGQWWW